MENSTKNKLAALAAHTLFLTCAGAMLIFISSAGSYLEKIKNSIFITAYSDARKAEDLNNLSKRIEAIAGVKRLRVLPENEILAAVEGTLTLKDTLIAMQGITMPSVIRVYPEDLNYENFIVISSRIEALHGIKASDSGGSAVKKLFIFASAFQKAVRLITALLLLSALGAALTAAASIKYLSERFQFLAERKLPMRNIILRCAAGIIIIPLSSLILSLLILLAFYEAGDGVISFLSPAQLLILLLLAALPAAARLVKSA